MAKHSINEKERFEIANDTRKFEIGLFWQRSLFFWGFIATTFAGYIFAIKENLIAISVILACFGVVCSLAWTLVNRGSKFWQENWEGHIHFIKDNNIIKTFRPLWYLNPPEFHGARKFSPSRITIALSDYVLVVWVSALVYPFFKLNTSLDINEFDFIFSTIVVTFTIIYIVWLLYKTKSKVYKKFEQFEWKKDLTKE